MRARLRAGFRLQRFEIRAALVVGLVLAGSALLVWFRLASLHVDGACFPYIVSVVPLPPCALGVGIAEFNDINNTDANAVMLAMAVLPLLVGMVLGVGVVAPEIEAGTAPTAWVLARSRARWLGVRMLPSLIAATAILALLAAASQVLWLARYPYLPDRWLNFEDASLHGPILVAKGLAAYGVAMAVGALLGRALPAAILATIIIWVGLAGTGTVARSLWMRAEGPNHVVAVDGNVDLLAFPGGRITADAWRTADGRLLGHEEAYALVPPTIGDTDFAARREWVASHLTHVYFGVPGELFPAWDAAETAAYAAVGIIAVGAAFLVVRRRRPYP